MYDKSQPKSRVNCPMSNDLKLLCEIYRMNISGEPASITSLVSSLEGVMSKMDIFTALDTLDDWFLIEGEYGVIGNGRAGRVYYVDRHQVYTVEKLYEKHWKGLK